MEERGRSRALKSERVWKCRSLLSYIPEGLTRTQYSSKNNSYP